MFIPLVKPILRITVLIISIAIWALTILAAYGGRFNTDFFTIPAVLTLALPYLAILSAIITVLWFCFGRIFAGALGVLAIIASWGPITTVSPFHSPKEANPGAQTFTIMTYNIIHGWDMEKKDSAANRTIDYLTNSGMDIICVQELVRLDSVEVPRLTSDQLVRLREAYPFIVGDPSNDMKVFSKYPVVFENGYNYIEGNFDKKRYTFYKVNINGHRLTLINVHLMSFLLNHEELDEMSHLGSIDGVKKSINVLRGPVRQKLSQGFKKRKVDVEILRRTIDRMKGAMIICGDFNDVPESYAYRLLKGDDLKDAYVETGFGPMITYNQHKFWFHLDQIFYRGNLKALSVRKGKEKISDHYPLVAEFEFTE